MLFGIHDRLAEHDLKLTLARMTDEQLTDGVQLPKLLGEWCCDGMLVNYTDDVPSRMRDLINDHHLPAIWVNTLLEHDCVYMDDEQGALAGTQALIAAGHRRIAYVDYTHGPDKVDPHYSVAARLAGYEKAMSEAGLRQRIVKAPTGVLMPRAQRIAFSESWLSAPDRPTAVVAYGGEDVTTILYVAHGMGLKVPRDLSVISFGESCSSMFGPSVATMVLPTDQMGKRAVELLLEKVAMPDIMLPSLKLSLSFEPGQTIAPPMQDR